MKTVHQTEPLKLTLPNDPAYLSVAIRFVNSVAECLQLDERAQTAIELSVEEAVTNVLHHAYAPGERASYDIICQKSPLGLEIHIRDMGLPYDPSQVPQYQPAKDLEQQPGSGLGSYLMKQFMDRVEFRNLGLQGKETVLVKYFTTPLVGGGDQGQAEPPALSPLPAAPPDTTIDIRLMQPSEAIKVAQCVYDAYGYSYPFEHIYYPERLAALNQAGHIVSAVAVTEQGDIAGHMALLFSDQWPSLAEIGAGVTTNAYRGQAVAQRLAEYARVQADSHPLQGVFAHPVAVHPFTQKVCAKMGMHTCGFLLCYIGNSVAFKNIAEQTSNRSSIVMTFDYLTRPNHLALYMPSKHEAIIKKIYTQWGVPVTQATASTLLSEQSILQVSVNTLNGSADIYVDVCGQDAAPRLQQELWRLRRDGLPIITVYLNMTSPGTTELAAEAERMGLLFTGIMPGSQAGDRLVMQYFNGIVVDYNLLKIIPGFTTELFAYVKQHDPQAN